MNLANHRLIQIVVWLLSALMAIAQAAPLAYDPGCVIVRFDGPTTLGDAQQMLDKSRYSVTEAIVPSSDIYLVELAPGVSVSEATAQLKQDGRVRWVQPDHWMDLRSTTPDDPQFPSQWCLEQLSDADIDAPEAWDLATGGNDAGGNEIVIAVVDNGAFLDHLDLAPNIWVNEEEIPGNGVDDEGNGYIDDINGWDAFYSDGSIPIPATSHGTHVTGIVGACSNNLRQVAGINWQAHVMVVAASSSKTSVVARGYNYVLTQKNRWLASDGLQGANVVVTNSSFGVNYGNCQADSFPIWNDLYNAMGQAGILSAAATANLAIDVDLRGDVPTSCSSPYLISVTNTTDMDIKNAGAAWGDTTIDLGAPGTNILSTINTGTAVKSGTSMASPHVAGAVALLHAAASPDFYVYYMEHPDSAVLYLKQVLLDSVDVLPGFDTLTASGGRLNLYRAATAVNSFVGPEPTLPMLVYAGQAVEDEVTGDGDSVLEAGEDVRLIVTVANYGAEATDVNATVSTSDPYLTISDSVSVWATIPASSSTDNAFDPFDLEADTSAPLEHEALMTLTLTASGGYSAVRYFHVTIGQGVVYYSFDCESSDSGWTHDVVTPGFGDQWHLSTEMNSSPTHAWKCGSTGTAGYALHLDAGLVSPEVEITPYSALYFSHWMDSEPSVAYGDSAYDGGVIEVSADGGPFEAVTPTDDYARAFCMVRKGLPYTGPMPGQPCYSGNIYWMQQRVNLFEYAGQTIQVRFRFGSDNDTVATEEGWYVDDILIRGQAPPPLTVDSVRDVVILPSNEDLQLFWTAPVSGADYYVIYRNSDCAFLPTPADSIGSTSDTTYTDVGGATVNWQSFYIVTARRY